MNVAPVPTPTRAFAPFLDAIDGTLCVPAHSRESRHYLPSKS